LKQALLLNGVQQGTINPVAAVGLDRDPGVGALGAGLASSLGNSPLTTALAVTGGFSNDNYYAPYGGSVFGRNGIGNYLALNSVLGSNNNNFLTDAVLLGGLGGGYGGYYGR